MFIRQDEFIDNGTKYNLREVEAIGNVDKYFCGYKYNKSTILEDIVYVGTGYNINPGHELLKSFDKNFMKFLNKKSIECDRFSKTMLEPKSNSLYDEVLCFERLPFRYSRNPIADEKILKTILNAKDFDYSGLIQALSPRNRNDDLNNILYASLVQFEVTPSDFGKRAKMGWFEKMPNSDKEIYDKFLIEKEYYYNNGECNDSKAVGDYAELEFYKYLNRNRKPGERLLWVSRFIGDGFGYDIMSYDTNTENAVLYEVKGSVSLGNSTKIELTETETNMFKYSMANNIEYHAVKVFFRSDKEIMYDIYCKDGEIKVNIINDIKRNLIQPDLNEKKLVFNLL